MIKALHRPCTLEELFGEIGQPVSPTGFVLEPPALPVPPFEAPAVTLPVEHIVAEGGGRGLSLQLTDDQKTMLFYAGIGLLVLGVAYAFHLEEQRHRRLKKRHR